MSDISIDRTLWAGFRVAWGNPKAFGLWIVVYLVCGIGPSMLLWTLIGPDFVDLMRTSARTGQPDTLAYATAMTRMNGISALSSLGGIFLYAVLYPAIFRAVLQPQKRAFGFLRLGLAELLVGVMFIVLYIGLMVVALVAMLVIMIAVFAALAAKSVAAAVGLGLLFGLGAMAGSLWLAVRLSLLMPKIVATGQIDIGKAWTMTRGHTGKLFVVGLLLVLVLFGMTLVMFALFGAVAVALVGASGGVEGLTSYFSQPAQALVRQLTPWGVGLAAISGVWGALQLCLMAAPWAEAYRQIVEKTEMPAEVFG